MMEKGNVLIIGNSGVGKSTLINAVLGEERLVTGFGSTGTTKELSINEHPDVPFRLIDTVGFEPSYLKERAAIRAVRKWSKNSAKEGNEDTRIHVIWFCIDGTSGKLFPNAIQNLSRATSMWPSVPVIVVITKSYSVPERSRNIDMVHQAFAMQKRFAKNLKQVIPVVAMPYILNDTAFAPPDGITELIDATIELLPEGMRAAGTDIASFKLNRKRALAHATVAAATAAAVVVGAVPIPFPDAMILSPLEVAEINALSQIYGLGKNEESKRFMNSIVEAGTVGLAAKTAINTLKAIPGLSLGTSLLNAVIAGSIVAALGEGSVYAFEQVYLGKKSTADIDWVKKIIESKFSSRFVGKVTQAIGSLSDKSDNKSIVQLILELFNPKS